MQQQECAQGEMQEGGEGGTMDMEEAGVKAKRYRDVGVQTDATGDHPPTPHPSTDSSIHPIPSPPQLSPYIRTLGHIAIIVTTIINHP